MGELSCIDCGHETHLGLGTNDECHCFGEKLIHSCDECYIALENGVCPDCDKKDGETKTGEDK